MYGFIAVFWVVNIIFTTTVHVLDSKHNIAYFWLSRGAGIRLQNFDRPERERTT